MWDTGEFVGLPYLGIFEKIVDGSLSGTVLVQSCLETRSELEQPDLAVRSDLPESGAHVPFWKLPCSGLSRGAAELWASAWVSEENAWGQSFSRCWGKSRNQVGLGDAGSTSEKVLLPRDASGPRPQLLMAPGPYPRLTWNAPHPGSNLYLTLVS